MAACVAVISVGFLAVNLVLAGQSLNTLSSHITVVGTIIAVAAVSALLAVFGYDVMHSAAWLLSWVGGVVLLLAFVWVIAAGHLAVGFWHSGQVSAVGFAGAVSVAVLWQISYTPYAADFSRYLPAATPARQTFLASFLGTSAGSIAAMLARRDRRRAELGRARRLHHPGPRQQHHGGRDVHRLPRARQLDQRLRRHHVGRSPSGRPSRRGGSRRSAAAPRSP